MIGQLYKHYIEHPFVYIDTRQATTGGIFVAVGQRDEKGVHRGNQFAEQAVFQLNASLAIINDADLKAKFAHDHRFVLVQDGEQTLQQLANYHRRQLTNVPILAIAGSNGKTTTKELLYHVLSQKYKTFATKGNLNNYLGVPLTLLQLNDTYEFAILEIGANHLDETAFLANLIEPDYGIVTNCGKDHLGEYGSLENIIKGNKELYDYLAKADKMAFVSANDTLLTKISKHIPKRQFYGESTSITSQVATPDNLLSLKVYVGKEMVRIDTQLFGHFWRDMVLGVACIGTYFKIPLLDIKKAIEAYKPAALRSEQLVWNQNQVLLDCYNANPSSMEVFVRELQRNAQENKILILGEMLELGQYSPAEHQTLVNGLDIAAFAEILLVGHEFEAIELPQTPNLRHFDSTSSARDYVLAQGWQSKHIYVKGSRGNKLETIFK